MPAPNLPAIVLRLELLQAKRLACLERLAKEETWSNEFLADHEQDLLAALDQAILDLLMERQVARRRQ